MNRRIRNGGIALALCVLPALVWLSSDHSLGRPLRPPGAPCRPEPGFAPSAMPDAQEAGLVSHVERIRIDAPLAANLAFLERQSLEHTIQESALPHVTGTYDLTPGGFGAMGSRRLTCLSDGSSLVEQVLVADQTADTARFRYMVWDYTSPKARGVHHAIGEFVRRSAGQNATEVTWTYSFALRRDRFPGRFGPLGRFAFRKAFLERDYAQMMRNTLAAEKGGVEASAQRAAP